MTQASALSATATRCIKQSVYLAFEGQSHPYELYKAPVRAALFRNNAVEVHLARTHWDPPHRAEPERFARALRDRRARAEGRTTAPSTRSAAS